MMMFNVLNAATWSDMAKKKEKGFFDFEFITWMAWTWQTAALFISLLGSVFIHLFWLALVGSVLWIATIICIGYAVVVFRYV